MEWVLELLVMVCTDNLKESMTHSMCVLNTSVGKTCNFTFNRDHSNKM